MYKKRSRKLTIDVTEATCLALLRMMKSTSPVDCDIAFATVETSSTLHASTSTNTTELEESVKDRAIVTNIVLPLLLCERVHVVWCHFLEEVDVLVSVELGHFMTGGGFGALQAY